jgi:hypothetical protein
MSVATDTIEITKEQEMKMYSDNELTPCSTCSGLGIFAPDLYGKETFFHKIPSTIQGYFTFTTTHLN